VSSILKKNRETRIPHCIKGFEHINRYWDRTHDSNAAKILPGEFYVTRESELVTTVLGSCVSACIRDVRFGIGGMNHFMLPASKLTKIDTSKSFNEATRYGNHAMEMLINEILKAGGLKKNLEVKITGGGKVLSSMTQIDVGDQNIRFIKEFTALEGLNVVSEDLGDIFPRKVIYYPESGRLLVKKLRNMHNDTLAKREERYQSEIKRKSTESDVELF